MLIGPPLPPATTSLRVATSGARVNGTLSTPPNTVAANWGIDWGDRLASTISSDTRAAICSGVAGWRTGPAGAVAPGMVRVAAPVWARAPRSTATPPPISPSCDALSTRASGRDTIVVISGKAAQPASMAIGARQTAARRPARRRTAATGRWKAEGPAVRIVMPFSSILNRTPGSRGFRVPWPGLRLPPKCL
ncbi:hypothetical protein D3C80_916710 [compost metagenome]